MEVEHLLTSAPASMALMGQTVLMTMMGTDASLLFNSYDGQVARDAEGALKIFQWATTIRADVVHLVLCGCRAIEVGQKYVQLALDDKEQQPPVAYWHVISESHELVQSALSRAIDHANRILLEVTAFLGQYPRKPATNPAMSTAAGSVYSTVELMRQALVRSQKAFDQLAQSWHKFSQLFSIMMQGQVQEKWMDLLDIYSRISHDYITPAAISIRALLATAFDADQSKNENATMAVEKARDEMMSAYNNACQMIKSIVG